MNINDAPEVMTVAQAAQVLGVAQNTVYLMVKRGEIPNRRVGRQIRFYKPEIVRWLAATGDSGRQSQDNEKH